MIHFSRLRLSGFKSFVDPTEMAIEAGMTGIVGPNGCGKSNLVEALRWVMGEGSARQMRGAEMDDVIFAGSAHRPRRDVAEVAVVLDNRDGALPPPFDTAAEIEVARRIGRGDGSVYRVNGKEARARDVQTLFADLASGARSTAIVGQGHIGAIINARPADRRLLLEEAAGIAGLQSRRHEAELRLKAAETNLERLADVLDTLGQQLQGLKKQARHAARYRSVSERIREAEAALLAAEWHRVAAAADAAAAVLAEAEAKVATLTGLAARAATHQAEAQAGLPGLRAADAAAAEHLQRLRQAVDQLTAEEARIGRERADLAQRLAQIDADREREAARAADAAQALERLGTEQRSLTEATDREGAREAEAQAILDAANAESARLEGELTRMMEKVAAADAERGAALKRLAEIEERARRLAGRLADLDPQRARAGAELVDPALLTSAEMDKEEADEHLAHCRTRVEETETARAHTQTAAETARETLQSLNAAQARLAAEADGLRALLAPGGNGRGKAPVIDEIVVVPGYEAALGAALGEDLSAPVDETAPRRWQAGTDAGPVPALPDGVRPLAAFVTAPPALARRLAQIGVVADADEAARQLPSLAVGQRLVAVTGGLWRWDGFIVAASAPSPAAERLRQRARLRELEARLGDGRLGLDAAREAATQATAAAQAAVVAERESREAVKKAEADSRRLAEAHFRLAQKAACAAERMTALDGQRAALAAEAAETDAAREAARTAMARFPEGGADRERLAALRADVAERRTRLVEARSAFDRLKAEAADRRRRLAAIAAEQASWRDRAEAADRQNADLTARRTAAEGEKARLDALPEEIAARRARLLDEVGTAERARRGTADALAMGEQAGRDADRLARDAEQALAAGREIRARREAERAAADTARETLARRIAERTGASAETLPAPAEDTAEDLAQRLERLVRERESMGPVNLMAETEAVSVEGRIADLTAERDDLQAAIARLRHGIAEINREGRERLLASFETVDRHFRGLFVRLFGGGRAHLALTEAADPLQAGLEIMASPPGKRLQILTLLSGGEQVLTALALLFAVFKTNPAPICVLDEVDAPLDDANVDRFCSMVAEMTGGLGTRFLVVTHHRMTMARMDRLYGVTMAERGVSTLVSVNLRRAEELSEASPG